MEKIIELKVKAFDLIRLSEQHQIVIQQITSELQKIAEEIKQEELKEKD